MGDASPSLKMGGYARGRAREGSVQWSLRKDGWFTIRCFKSAGGDPGEPVKPIDVIAFRADQQPLFLQVSKKRTWISEDEIKELLRLAKKSGTIPMLVYKGLKGEFLYEKVTDDTKTGEFWYGNETEVKQSNE